LLFLLLLDFFFFFLFFFFSSSLLSVCSANPAYNMQAVLGIRIRMFLGFLDPDPYPLVRGTGPDLVVM
jgi:hypothetical protein